MPNYLIYDPQSTPVPGRVVRFLRSFPQEKESTIEGVWLKDPNLEGIGFLNEAKVVDGTVVALTRTEKDAIAAAADAAEKTAVKRAAKDIFVTPSGSQEQAIRLGFQVFSELMLAEINALRTAAGLTPRTQAQFNTAFRTNYESKIDALS